MRRLLVVAVLWFGCKEADKKPAPKPAEPPPATASGSAASSSSAKPSGPCEKVDLELASKILADASHPCRARVDAALGRMIFVGVAFSGTVVTTTPARGAGLVITCQHCTGVDSGDPGVREPEKEDPVTFQARAPAKLADHKITSGTETELYFVYRLFSPTPPKSAFDAKGHLVNILPKDDFVVGTISGKSIGVVGHLGALPSAKVDDTKLALHDPREIARSQQPWADAKPNTRALVLGFPRDLPDKKFGGELVASVGEILDDARAKDLLSRSDPDEAAIPYDPTVELVVAARAVPGMSGGGTFDEDGRYLGVNVRGTVKPVDGLYLIRVVRAPYIMKQLDAALAAAPESTRAKVKPFVTP